MNKEKVKSRGLNEGLQIIIALTGLIIFLPLMILIGIAIKKPKTLKITAE